HSELSLLVPFGLEVRIALLQARRQRALPGDARLQQIAVAAQTEERGVGQSRHCGVCRRFLAGLTIRDVQLPVGKSAGAIAVIEQIAERPGGARLRVVGPRVRAPERREAVVADAEIEHQLIEHADLSLSEIRLDMPQSPILLYERSDGVLNVVRRRCNELFTKCIGLTQTARVKVLADGERQIRVGAER